MDFFEKLGGTITSKGKQVAQKAKDLAELSKLHGQVSTEEEVIRSAYITIGKLYFDECKDQPEGEYATEVEKINNATERIKKLEQQIHQLRGIINCPSCGEEISVDASFCSSCGVKLEKEEVVTGEVESEEVDVTDNVVVLNTCPSCGNVISKEDEVCPSCGKDLKEE